MILRLATHVTRRVSASNLERARIPWPLVVVCGVALTNVTAVLLTLSGQ